MLEGLDQISWDRLKHAHGSAADVPETLSALAKATGKSWQDDDHPLRSLYQTIWHQGTVYSATAAAVPFLIELAADESVRCRTEIVSFLGDIAAAEPDGPAGLEVAKGFDLFRGLITACDPEMRAAAAHAISSLGPRKEDATDVLLSAANKEGDALTLAGMLLCVALSGEAADATVDLLTRVVETSRKRAPRTAAAIALATLLGPKTPHKAAKVLTSAVEADWFEECLQGLPWDVYANIDPDELIQALGPVPTSDAIARKLAALDKPGADAGFILQDLIRLGFEQRGPWKDAALSVGLTDDQRAVIRAVVRSDSGWRESKGLFWFFLADAQLPTVRWQLAELIDETHRFPRPSAVDDLGRPRRKLDKTTLRVGERVYHMEYGPGTITKMEGTSAAHVMFDTEGDGCFVLDHPKVEFYSI